MTIDLSNPGRTLQAGVILMGHTEILDVAPIDILHGMSKKFVQIFPIPDEMKAKALDIEFHWVSEKGEKGKLTAGLSAETLPFEECPPLDIVLIGAYFPGYTPTEAELAFIRKAYDDCSAFINICGGMVPAQLAGVLAGHTCTAPLMMIDMLKEKDPRTTWVAKRYVRSGKVWTSGALLNGLDLMRDFAREYWPELAQMAIVMGGYPQRDVEYTEADLAPAKAMAEATPAGAFGL